MTDKEKYQQKLGNETGELFYYLQQEVLELNYKLHEHTELYGTHFSRLEKVLAPSASSFFGLLYQLMFDDLLLCIARLTDPENTRNNKNISIQRLQDLTIPNDHNFKTELKTKIDTLLEKVKPIKEMRNKRIAHLDYNFNITALPNLDESKANRLNIQECTSSLIEILNFVEVNFFEHPTEYNVIVLEGASDLLWTLYEGLRFKNNREARLNNNSLEDYEDEKRNPIYPDAFKEFGL